MHGETIKLVHIGTLKNTYRILFEKCKLERHLLRDPGVYERMVLKRNLIKQFIMFRKGCRWHGCVQWRTC